MSGLSVKGIKGFQPRLGSSDRVWPNIDFLEECWLWTGNTDKDGYGRLSDGNLAHRTVYLLVIGCIAKGLELDHLCRVKNCVNPNHLEPVTHLENMRRSRGTWVHSRALRTHCLHGHEYTPENTATVTKPSGRQYRQCRICSRLSWQRSQLKRNQAAEA